LAIRRFQRQKLKRARNAVRGNNASQPVSIAKPSMMPSYDSLENRYRQFEFTSLHHSVRQFSDIGLPLSEPLAVGALLMARTSQ
jgi:hypothetical protein